MKAVDVTTFVIVVIGGLNWGLIGIFQWDLVSAIFGAGSVVTRIVYIIVGLSALWQLMPAWRMLQARGIGSSSST